MAIHLPYQEKDEKILLVLRRVWIVFFRHLLFALFLLVLPFVIYFLLLNFAPEWLEATIFSILVIFFALYCLFILLFGLVSWIKYYFDVWIVTDKKILSIDQIGLFERVTSEARHERVQDITVEVRGFLPSILHYGNVHVQTAAETPRFSFMQIRRPYEVKRLLSELHSKALQKEEPGYEMAKAEPEYPKAEEKYYKEAEEKSALGRFREQREAKPGEPKPKESLGKISDYRK